MGTVSSDISPWASSGSITAPEARLALGASWAKSPTSSILTETGMIEGASPAVSVSGNNVLVTPHQCVVEASGGTYECTSIVTMTVPIDTPLPSSGQSRIDLVVAQVSGTDTAAVYQLTTVKGTAAASPTAPSVPANTVPLYRVPVTNAGPQAPVAIWSWTRAAGAARLVEDTDTRNGSYVGDQRKFKNGRIDSWTGTTWITIVAPAAWSQADVPFNYAGNGSTAAGAVNFGSGGSSICRYKRAGNDLTVSYESIWGTGGGSGAGAITTVLPNSWVSPAGRDQWIPCHLWVNDQGYSNFSGDMAGLVLIQGNSNIVRPYFPRDGGFAWMKPYKVADTPGVAGQSWPQVGGGYARGGRLHITGTVELAS